MSRVGKNPVDLPKGVEVKIEPDGVSVKGPLGTLTQPLSSDIRVKQEGERLLVEVANAESKNAGALSGTTRALLANMVTGVTKGFEKRLALVGVGYRAEAQGDKLNLFLGLTRLGPPKPPSKEPIKLPVVYHVPKGVKCETPTQTEIVVKGNDKQQVGQVAAEVRAYRPPEPYKGKGVRYVNEVVIIKETKKK